jgi:hypothetical protein
VLLTTQYLALVRVNPVSHLVTAERGLLTGYLCTRRA